MAKPNIQPAKPKPEIEPKADVTSLTITIPLSRVASKRYMSGRVDTDLRHSEQLIFRRIQDAMEESGKPVKGTAAVLRHLLALMAAAESEAK